MYYVIKHCIPLAPTLTVNINPVLFTGNSGEDALELLCTAAIAEDVMSASYQFTWIKDDTPVDESNDRIVVREVAYKILKLICIGYCYVQILFHCFL